MSSIYIWPREHLLCVYHIKPWLCPQNNTARKIRLLLFSVVWGTLQIYIFIHIATCLAIRQDFTLLFCLQPGTPAAAGPQFLGWYPWRNSDGNPLRFVSLEMCWLKCLGSSNHHTLMNFCLIRKSPYLPCSLPTHYQNCWIVHSKEFQKTVLIFFNQL